MVHDAVDAWVWASHIGHRSKARFTMIVDRIGNLGLQRILLVIDGIKAHRSIEVAFVLECCFSSMRSQLGIDLADQCRIALEMFPEPILEALLLLRVKSIVDPQSHGEG